MTVYKVKVIPDTVDVVILDEDNNYKKERKTLFKGQEVIIEHFDKVIHVKFFELVEELELEEETTESK